jgi:hypothetical protein
LNNSISDRGGRHRLGDRPLHSEWSPRPMGPRRPPHPVRAVLDALLVWLMLCRQQERVPGQSGRHRAQPSPPRSNVAVAACGASPAPRPGLRARVRRDCIAGPLAWSAAVGRSREARLLAVEALAGPAGGWSLSWPSAGRSRGPGTPLPVACRPFLVCSSAGSSPASPSLPGLHGLGGSVPSQFLRHSHLALLQFVAVGVEQPALA